MFESDRHERVRGMGFGGTHFNVFGAGPSTQQRDQELSRYEARKAKEDSALPKEEATRPEEQSTRVISLNMFFKSI